MTGELVTLLNLKEKIPNYGEIVVTTNFLFRNYTTPTSGKERNEGDTDGRRGDLAKKLIADTLEIPGARINAYARNDSK